MGVVCKICGTGCQGCGRKCKCGYNASMIGTVNSLYDLGMGGELIKSNIGDIYNKRRLYTPMELFEWYVNGVELEDKKVKMNEMEYKPVSYQNTVLNFTPSENPNPTCVYKREGDKSTPSVWDRCIYCNEVKHYHKGNCSSFRG